MAEERRGGDRSNALLEAGNLEALREAEVGAHGVRHRAIALEGAGEDPVLD
jgi:DNA-binding transcriptional regulator YbjK